MRKKILLRRTETSSFMFKFSQSIHSYMFIFYRTRTHAQKRKISVNKLSVCLKHEVSQFLTRITHSNDWFTVMIWTEKLYINSINCCGYMVAVDESNKLSFEFVQPSGRFFNRTPNRMLSLNRIYDCTRKIKFHRIHFWDTYVGFSVD